MSPSLPTQARGLTLLEVLIAISIFALIGLASYRVLTTVVATQRAGDDFSQQLGMLQKALTVIDRDLQQFVDRRIRDSERGELPSLMVANGDFAVEFTRGGWQNPLALPRSALQRVAYDLGSHPLAAVPGSPFFGDERVYLRRLYWPTLDRNEDTPPRVQALLPAVDSLQIVVWSDRGKFNQWPVSAEAATSTPPQPSAIEFSITSEAMGSINRVYSIGAYRP